MRRLVRLPAASLTAVIPPSSSVPVVHLTCAFGAVGAPYHPVPAEEIEELQVIYKMMDTNKSGGVDLMEMGRALR